MKICNLFDDECDFILQYFTQSGHFTCMLRIIYELMYDTVIQVVVIFVGIVYYDDR